MLSHIQKLFLSRNHTMLDLINVGGVVALSIEGEVFKAIIFCVVFAIFSAILEMEWGYNPDRMEFKMIDGNPSIRFDDTVSDNDIAAVRTLANVSIQRAKEDMNSAQ